MCFEFAFLAVVDGGSLEHGTANRGYGSYHLANSDGRQQTVRLHLGTATNTANTAVLRNEAEYRTLIAALQDLMGRIQRAGRVPSDYSLLVHTGSQLMVGQLTLSWQVKAANPSTPLRTGLRSLVDEAATLIKAFGRCDPLASLRTGLIKVPRHEIVRVLGH